ncbi:hypothetical protein ACFSWE_09270 [Leucobacter albus]|uniref:Uncharacterized protein n=1 Tax=Leucobacter albus TaxID=272210 RepID=A0ABW3TQY2_9MICO
MAAIDDKMNALHFSAPTAKNAEQISQLLADAADLAAALGGKVTLAYSAPGQYTGIVKNFVRVEHARFTVRLLPGDGGAGHTVQFAVDDYMRVRDTVLAFIPVSPWGAPAYKPLREFVQRVQNAL